MRPGLFFESNAGYTRNPRTSDKELIFTMKEEKRIKGIETTDFDSCFSL